MRFLLFLVCLVIGLGAGGAGAYFLTRTSPVVAASPQDESDAAFADLGSQFVVPLTRGGTLTGVVAVSLAVQLKPGKEEEFEVMEPRLRDVYLEVLFRHGASGGFDGDFATSQAMADLRTALDRVTQDRLSDIAERVLITSLARQDY